MPRFSASRRSAFKGAGAAALALFMPGCGPAGPAKTPPAKAGDFTDGALRLDLRQRVAGATETFELEGIRLERRWSGRGERLAAGPDWGDYRLSVNRAGQEVLLFRRGFDTELAPDAHSATAQLSIRLPLPQGPVQATIEKRRGETAFAAIAAFAIDPAAASVDRSATSVPARVDTLFESGTPAGKVDIAILGDGYSEAEYSKFAADAARVTGYIFSVEPFKARSRDFNVRAVFAPSVDAGVTDPYLGVARNTALRCAYGSGAAERTLAVGDNRVLREVAAAAPYDVLLVLANARRYGGSAYFGGPAVVAIDSAAARYLVLHELAHVMAGLAEEYYVPAGAGPVYGGNIEPWQPNVTRLAERAKWRNLLPGSPRPSAWNKSEYDRRFAAYVRRYDRLRESGADEGAIEKLMEDERRQQATLLEKGGDPRQPGCYEGAMGYARGMFRSAADCIMFSLQSDYFCPACTAALSRAIDEECS